MCLAIVRGLVKSKTYLPSEILLCSRTDSKLAKIKEELGVNVTSSKDDFKKQISDDTFIMLAIKPQQFEEVLQDLSGIKDTNPLISVAAGVKIKTIEKAFPQNEVYRVMPNTPAQVSKGASAISSNSQKNLDKVQEIFSAIGACAVVEEKDMDAVTALSGSGPAYIFLMTEAMTNAAIKLGLDAKTAETLARQTVYGASSLMIESGESAEALRKKVTSPNGTTQAGIENFQANNLEEVVFKALEAAKKRSIELS